MGNPVKLEFREVGRCLFQSRRLQYIGSKRIAKMGWTLNLVKPAGVA
ncbi:MAG: hypothetical protein NZ867_11495 [SAR324 cluster bacterium]|nr:hypothetical protein [SAR324 cluster bacterium]